MRGESDFHHWLTLAEIGLAVVTFLVLLFVRAPYGRHYKGGWGPSIGSRIGWAVMEAPAVVVFALVFGRGDLSLELLPLLFLGLWQCHYLYRAFVFPCRLRGRGKRVPLLVPALSILFNTLNAYINARWLSQLGRYETDWLSDPRFSSGVALFLVGLAINLHSDEVLLRLRRKSEGGYRIPQGGLFRLVSCPNYLGEIVEWIGWAVATWSLPGLAFSLFTIANLAPRAVAHHRWYRRTFADYPRGRRALVPFLV